MKRAFFALLLLLLLTGCEDEETRMCEYARDAQEACYLGIHPELDGFSADYAETACEERPLTVEQARCRAAAFDLEPCDSIQSWQRASTAASDCM